MMRTSAGNLPEAKREIDYVIYYLNQLLITTLFVLKNFQKRSCHFLLISFEFAFFYSLLSRVP